MAGLKQTTEDELSEIRLRAILLHIHRYRIGTFASFQQLAVLRACGPRAVKKVLRGIEQRSLIGSSWLDATRRYWFLTPRGIEKLGLTAVRSGPLSPDARIRAAGTLFFCMLGSRRRHLLTLTELRQRFGTEATIGLPSGYYLEPGDTNKFGLVRIDGGHSGRWDRIVESIREDIARQWRVRPLRPLIQSGAFEITIVTATPQKAQRLDEAIKTASDLSRVTVRVAVCQELVPVIATATSVKGR